MATAMVLAKRAQTEEAERRSLECIRFEVCDQQLNTYMFLLYMAQKEEEKGRLNFLLRRVADRARTWDEYEISPDVRSIAGSNTRIVWNNLEWTIEDFSSLLIAADDLETARLNRDYVEDDRGQAILADADSDPYPTALLNDPIVSSNRAFLKCFLLWFSIYYDTRIERLFCKVSNVHAELDLSWPPPRKIVMVRERLFRCLGTYIFGYCSQEYFSNAVEMAYTRGTNLISSLEESAADSDARANIDELLFDPVETVFGSRVYMIRLVIRSPSTVFPDGSEEDIDNSSEKRTS